MFCKRGKLTPRFIGVLLQRVGPVAYYLALPPPLQGIHDVFHVSNLCWYVPDPNHIIRYEALQHKENLTYIEEPVRILEQMECTLHNKTIPFVKVFWRHDKSVDATWEPEQTMRAKYLGLFSLDE